VRYALKNSAFRREGKRLLGIPIQKREDNIKMVHKYGVRGGMDSSGKG
jgi:hypothetical protein